MITEFLLAPFVEMGKLEGRNALTYFEQDSSRCPGAFGDVDCVAVGGVGDHGEDLRGKPDWGTLDV